MTDTQNKALYVKEQCMAAGMTLAGAAGVIANIEPESAWKPNNLEDQYNTKFGVSDDDYTKQVDAGTRNFIDYAGYGLIQWTANDRKKQLLDFAKSRGASIGDFKMQVAFMLKEMKGFTSVWNTCCTSDSPYKCGYDICVYYEIPANKYAQGEYRGNLAKNWYDWLSKHSGDESDIPDDEKQDDRPVTTSWPPRTIDRNCLGWPEVWLLQAILKCRGYNVLVDGMWGQSLNEAVKVFQAQNHLDPDGIVGPKTWAALLDRG